MPKDDAECMTGFILDEQEAALLCGGLALKGVENIPGLTILSRKIRSTPAIIDDPELMAPLQGLVSLVARNRNEYASALIASGRTREAILNVGYETERDATLAGILERMGTSGMPLVNLILDRPQLTLEPWLGDIG